MNQPLLFIVAFLTAFLATALATPLSLIFIKKWGLFDDPKQHKHPAMIHKKPIPRGGGIPLFIGIWIAAIFFIPITKITIALFLASLCAVIIGTLDDKLDVSPYLRFFTNIVVAGIVVSSGVGIPFITNPFGGVIHLDFLSLSFDFFGKHSIIIFSDILALIWIVWVMNMLNWSKGVDGQMPGIVAISAIVIGLLSLRFPDTTMVAFLSFIIAGSAVGFLLYNFYPQRIIFPGYGATGIYLLLAVASLLSGAKLSTAILVMGIPMIDGIFTIFRRIASGKSPFWHDNKHLHHLLLRHGFGQRSIALFYWSISAIVGSISLALTSAGKLFAIVMLVVIVGGALLFLHNALGSDDDEIIH